MWSALSRAFWNHLNEYCDKDGDDFTRFIVVQIQDRFLGEPIDEIHYQSKRTVIRLKAKYTPDRWAEFYDLVQFMADLSKVELSGDLHSRIRRHSLVFVRLANEVLQEEKSAYRFVSGELVEITDDVEIAEIEDALESTGGFQGAKAHLRTALTLYGDRKNPDFRNAVKESISAVESAFFAVNDKKSNSLSAAISEAENNGLILPPALKEGIKKIYGWTSDEGGVRHALFDRNSIVGDSEAKMMIVMCSSLVNYLLAKSSDRVTGG